MKYGRVFQALGQCELPQPNQMGLGLLRSYHCNCRCVLSRAASYTSQCPLSAEKMTVFSFVWERKLELSNRTLVFKIINHWFSRSITCLISRDWMYHWQVSKCSMGKMAIQLWQLLPKEKQKTVNWKEILVLLVTPPVHILSWVLTSQKVLECVLS